MRLQKRLSSEGSSDDDESVGKDYDVVIIGNGPSAILLSYFLSGNWPYYNGKPIDDPILKERLRYVSQNKSLVLQDLEWLSEGMYDSRTMNPVSILFDHLFHPNADMLTNNESVIEWRYNQSNEVRHIVLGMGPAGGSWHYMNNSQLSVSLAQWLELPGYSYKEWFQENQYKVPNLLPKLSPVISVHPDRTHTALVGLYYMDYVKKQNMSQNFKNNVKVTSVRQCMQNDIMHWCIEGLQWVDETTTQIFTLFSDNVALAVGASNIPRKLYITGEHYDFVCHALPDIESMINQKLPVLVVGCGLVALDAVLKLIANRIPVYHVFRRNVKDPELILNQLPSAYADYLQLKPLMTGKLNNEYYKPLSQHNVVGILPNKEVIIEHTNKKLAYKVHVNRVIILVGLLPDLSILDNPDSLKEDPEKEFNIKTNPLDIDLYTYECRSRKGLYALGPLVGDNFVRLISGGALAITHGLFRKEYDAFDDSE